MHLVLSCRVVNLEDKQVMMCSEKLPRIDQLTLSNRGISAAECAHDETTYAAVHHGYITDTVPETRLRVLYLHYH
jgi:hypothetical protein